LFILRNASRFDPAGQFTVTALLLLLPLLVIPCYMLAHDLEDQAADITAERPARRLASVAVALRAVSGFIYIAYVLAAFGLNFLLLSTPSGVVSDLDVLLASVPYWLYLLVAPVLVLGLLAGLGRLQRRTPTRPTSTEPPLVEVAI
jgi:hypothetical protein